MKEELIEVELTKIVVNPHQPRKEFGKEELEELAESIKAVGILHPPLVYKRANSDYYEIVSGERRCRAARLAGLQRIPVVVRDNYEEKVSAEAALIENIQRVDLNPLEVAIALKELLERYGYSQEELGERIGKKRSTLANYLRLLTLPKTMQKELRIGTLTMGHAKAILSLEDEAFQNYLFMKVMDEALNVRETEQEANRILGRKAEPAKVIHENRDFYIEHLSEQWTHNLGLKVSIRPALVAKRGKNCQGKVVIEYKSLDDFELLQKKLGIQDELIN